MKQGGVGIWVEAVVSYICSTNDGSFPHIIRFLEETALLKLDN